VFVYVVRVCVCVRVCLLFPTSDGIFCTPDEHSLTGIKKSTTLLSFSIPPSPTHLLGGGDHFFVLVFLFSRTILFLVFPYSLLSGHTKKVPHWNSIVIVSVMVIVIVVMHSVPSHRS